MFGIYHGLDFGFERDFDDRIKLRTPLVDVILSGVGSVDVINLATGASVSPTITSHSWTINDKAYTSKRVQFSTSPGIQYVVVANSYYWSNIIEYAENCIVQLASKNDCSNQYHDWDNDSSTLTIILDQWVTKILDPKTETVTIATETGEKTKVIKSISQQAIEGVAPNSMRNILNSMRSNSYNAILEVAANEIRNIEIETTDQDSGRYAIFTLKYEYADESNSANACCEILNIDEIINPENPNGSNPACVDFTATIERSGDTLSATLANEPVGTPAYKWYRNGVLISTGANATVTTSGEYRVIVIITDCRANGTYTVDNECSDYTLEIEKTGNIINGSTSNVPDGETETISVKLNGVEVATSLPYTALATGTYFVYAYAGECTKVKGIYVDLMDSDCDFTVAITVNGSVLEADTDAGTPTYQWYVDYGTGGGKVALGTGATQAKAGEATYFLEVTNGTCTKEAYIAFANVAATTLILQNTTGDALDEFIVIGINFAATPISNITVEVDNTMFNFTGGTPVVPNTWSYTTDNKLILANSVSNSTIVIRVTV